MLMWKIKAKYANSIFLKDGTVMMKPVKHVLHQIEALWGWAILYIAAGHMWLCFSLIVAEIIDPKTTVHFMASTTRFRENFDCIECLYFTLEQLLHSWFWIFWVLNTFPSVCTGLQKDWRTNKKFWHEELVVLLLVVDFYQWVIRQKSLEEAESVPWFQVWSYYLHSK